MQSLEDDLYLCRNLCLDAVKKDYLSAVVVLEQRIDQLLDQIARRYR